MNDTADTDAQVLSATALAGEPGGLRCDVTGHQVLSLGFVLPLALVVGFIVARISPELL